MQSSYEVFLWDFGLQYHVLSNYCQIGILYKNEHEAVSHIGSYILGTALTTVKNQYYALLWFVRSYKKGKKCSFYRMYTAISFQAIYKLTMTFKKFQNIP